MVGMSESAQISLKPASALKFRGALLASRVNLIVVAPFTHEADGAFTENVLVAVTDVGVLPPRR